MVSVIFLLLLSCRRAPYPGLWYPERSATHSAVPQPVIWQSWWCFQVMFSAMCSFCLSPSPSWKVRVYVLCDLSVMKQTSSYEPNWLGELVVEKDAHEIARQLLSPWRLGLGFLVEKSSVFTSLEWGIVTVEITRTGSWSDSLAAEWQPWIKFKRWDLTKSSLTPHRYSLIRLALCTFLEISFDICEGFISHCAYLQKSGALLDKVRVCSKLSDFSPFHHLTAAPFKSRCYRIQDKWKCGRKKGWIRWTGDLTRGAVSGL